LTFQVGSEKRQQRIIIWEKQRLQQQLLPDSVASGRHATRRDIASVFHGH